MMDMQKVAERNASTMTNMLGQVTLQLSITETERDELKEQVASLTQQVTDLTAELETLRGNGEPEKEEN